MSFNFKTSYMGLICVMNSALALAGDQPANQGGLIQMLPMLFMIIFFMYFMILRPQNKKAKEQKDILSNLQVGDEVLTVGGVVGVIEAIKDDFVRLNISRDTIVSIQKNSIVSCLPKGSIGVMFK